MFREIRIFLPSERSSSTIKAGNKKSQMHTGNMVNLIERSFHKNPIWNVRLGSWNGIKLHNLFSIFIISTVRKNVVLPFRFY